jgi:hypothetical protein
MKNARWFAFLVLTGCFQFPDNPIVEFSDSETEVISALKFSYDFDTIIFQPSYNIRSQAQTASLTIILRAGANLPQDDRRLSELASELVQEVSGRLLRPEEFGQYHVIFQHMKKEVMITTGNSQSFTFDINHL